MRGPLIAPSSIARLSPNTGPPRSRTVVKPRIKVASACRVANIWRYEGLAVIGSGMDGNRARRNAFNGAPSDQNIRGRRQRSALAIENANVLKQGSPAAR